MKQRAFVAVALGAVALLAASLVMASNMGFKLNYQLTGPAAAPENGTNTIALPFNQQTGINTAADLAADINATGPGQVVQVSRYVKSTASLNSYVTTGADPVGFALVPGEGYRVQVDGNVNYIIVGSHDPGLGITLTGPAAAPENGTNTYTYPYHSIASNAAELAAEIDAAGGVGTVVQVSRYVKSTASLSSYVTSGADPTGFALVPGEAYRIQVGSDVTFTPAHY